VIVFSQAQDACTVAGAMRLSAEELRLPAMSKQPAKRPLGAERRRALELLASSRHGVNEEMLVHGHGFSRRMLAVLVRVGLAASERAVMMAGNKPVEVIRVRIADAGLRVIES